MRCPKTGKVGRRRRKREVRKGRWAAQSRVGDKFELSTEYGKLAKKVMMVE